MNWVLKRKTNRNPLEISKYLRNHSSIEVTNRYVQISEQHLNRLTKEISNKGYFGYTYEYLLKCLFALQNDTNLLELSHIEIVKEVFGDIYKIENLAIQLNQLQKQNLSLYEYVKSLSAKQLSEKIELIQLEQLPAKESFWQCIFGNCIYLERNCESCPFAIPHVYLLTLNLENINKYLNEYDAITLDDPPAEKTRVVNLIYRNLLILSSARKKFGENVIEAFLGYEYQILKKRISMMQNFYEYLTIQEL